MPTWEVIYWIVFAVMCVAFVVIHRNARRRNGPVNDHSMWPPYVGVGFFVLLALVSVVARPHAYTDTLPRYILMLYPFMLTGGIGLFRRSK